MGATAKTYDILEGTVATSIKSIDVGCDTYQTASGFKTLLNKYARDLSKGLDTIVIKKTIGELEPGVYPVEKKVLELVFPNSLLNTEQIKVLDDFINEWKDEFEIVFTIIQ